MLQMRPPMQRPAATPTGVAPTLARPRQMPAGGQSLPIPSNPSSNPGGAGMGLKSPAALAAGMAAGLSGGLGVSPPPPQPLATIGIGGTPFRPLPATPDAAPPEQTMYKKGGSVSAKEKKSSEHGKKYTHSDGKLNLGHGRVSTATKNPKHSNW